MQLLIFWLSSGDIVKRNRKCGLRTPETVRTEVFGQRVRDAVGHSWLSMISRAIAVAFSFVLQRDFLYFFAREELC